MGRLEDNTPINHFCHEYPLNLQNSNTQATCLACDMSVSNTLFYTCVSCNFYLHKTCSNLPCILKHKSDKSHDLVLLSSPAYPEGVFNCNACDTNGTGFSYHCPDCQLDLHVVCASMPLLIDHGAHGHKLGLCFRPPYENYQGFSCDICARPGSNQWLYRCRLCDFDAHMECVTSRTRSKTISKSTSLPHYKTQPSLATTPLPAQPSIKIYYSEPVQSPQVLSKSTSLPSYETYHFMPQSLRPPAPVAQPYYSQVTPAIGVPGYAQYPRQTSFATSMAGSAVQGVTGAVAQEILQSVFEGLIS
ncbi:protein VACUOLELESS GAMETOPHYTES-like [Bidens hawaiensis]|uniref:protein VACUOLELESS GAMETOPHYTES-like n=1 Tax=Bidens hawaiensis TaxID=980011 RepID=UPI004049356E